VSRIADTFARLRARREGALIVFTVAGDPSPEVTARLLLAIADAGADIIELGVPFSDPLADGPAIQAASQRALANAVTPAAVLDMAAGFRAQRDVPLVLMTCYNPICQFAVSDFARGCAWAGVDGVIVTDLPPEEADDWVAAARGQGVDTIFLLAPTSSPQRTKKVVEIATGFVYCVSRMGVTGERAELPSDLKELVARIRRETEKPIAVGFGVARPEHVAEVCRVADGAVVGSALVSLVAREQGSAEAAGRFVRELKAATRSRRAAERGAGPGG
jgi:tryptophan synthase alpha chain